jgi:phage anti-repressor protein
LLNRIIKQVPHQGSYRSQEVVEFNLSLSKAKELTMFENSEEGRFEVIQKSVKIRGEIVNKPVTLINPQGVSHLANRFKFAVSVQKL